MALTVLSKTFPITAGKSYVGQTRPGGGGGSTDSDTSWVPPVGYFADVPMLNNANDVNPSIYNAGEIAVVFDQWGGSAIIRDFSALGAQAYHSAGHESTSSQPNIQVTAVCDFSSRLWTAANVPVTANTGGSFNLTTNLAADGTPYSPHMYLGLQEFPAAWGGATRGSLAQFFWAGGTGVKDHVHMMDVTAANHGYTQLTTTQAQNSQPTLISFKAAGGKSGGNLPITVQDIARQGWWATTDGDIDYLLFISKTGAITQYGPGSNTLYGAAFLVPSLNLLCIHDGGYTAEVAPTLGYNPDVHRSMRIWDLSNMTVGGVLNDGPVPALRDGFQGVGKNMHAPRQLGLQWVEELGAAFGLDDTSDPLNPIVVKLTPPVSNPKTNAWVWSTVPLSHWSSGDPAGSATLRASINAVHSKFRWVATLGAFVYCAGKDFKPQVLRVG